MKLSWSLGLFESARKPQLMFLHCSYFPTPFPHLDIDLIFYDIVTVALMLTTGA